MVVSPHCDDAVFGCGDLLATRPGALVVTVFADGPPPDTALTPWDADCGFRAGDDVMAARRAEDAAALEILRARPHWLAFHDAQYGGTPEAAEISAALEGCVRAFSPDAMLYPLGLFHSDHDLVHRAARDVAARSGARAIAYEEPIYRRVAGRLRDRVDEIAALGRTVRRASPRVANGSDAKRRACECYASQLRGLRLRAGDAVEDLFAGEGYWEVQP
jgi:LmbE family N-acetylglucosaminyl deacetylase